MPCQPPPPHPRPPELPRATQRVKKDLLLYTVFIKSVPASTTPVKKYVSYLLGEPPAPPHRPPSLCPPTPPRCPPWREMSPPHLGTAGRSQWHGQTDGQTDGQAGGRRRVQAGWCPSPWHQGMRAGQQLQSFPPTPPTHPPSRPQATLPRAPQPAPRGARGAHGAPGEQQNGPSVAATGGQATAPTETSSSHPRCVCVTFPQGQGQPLGTWADSSQLAPGELRSVPGVTGGEGGSWLGGDGDSRGQGGWLGHCPGVATSPADAALRALVPAEDRRMPPSRAGPRALRPLVR